MSVIYNLQTLKWLTLKRLSEIQYGQAYGMIMQQVESACETKRFDLLLSHLLILSEFMILVLEKGNKSDMDKVKNQVRLIEQLCDLPLSSLRRYINELSKIKGIEGRMKGGGRFSSIVRFYSLPYNNPEKRLKLFQSSSHPF